MVKQPSSTVDAHGDTPGLGHCVLTAEGPDWWWCDIVVGSVVFPRCPLVTKGPSPGATSAGFILPYVPYLRTRWAHGRSERNWLGVGICRCSRDPEGYTGLPRHSAKGTPGLLNTDCFGVNSGCFRTLGWGRFPHFYVIEGVLGGCCCPLTWPVRPEPDVWTSVMLPCPLVGPPHC